MDKYSPYNNRDLSWLSFNGRVLEEAADISLPLYERIKFLAIYSSNLDEFYRVRVAGLKRFKALNKKRINKELNIDPDNNLEEIKVRVHRQLELFGTILTENILPGLRAHNIVLAYHKDEIPDEAGPSLSSYFKSRVLSYLQPVVLKPDEKAFLANRALYLMLKLTSVESGELFYAYVNIPVPPLDRFYHFQQHDTSYFIFLDDIIRLNLSFIFPGYNVSDGFCVKLNRDADLQIEDEFSGDLVEKIKTQLKKRNVGVPSRLLHDSNMPFDMLNVMMEATETGDEDLVPGGRYHNLHDLFTLPNPKDPEIAIRPWPAIRKHLLDKSMSIFNEIDKQDILFHFPYHSYDYVLRFFNEAAINPNVLEIKATFYRVAPDSFIVNALISAARNGKKVKAFIEVKARFDEENNLRWANKMKEAGVKITYSIPGLKVHAKAALVNKTDENGNIKSYAYLGTGNFNEKTAGIYADHGLLTAHKELTKEIDTVFKYIYRRKPIEKLNRLLVSQFNMTDRFNALIDREIENAKKGKKADILLKLNNIEDKKMIDRLYEAALAGVNIRLIIRGICCLKPGIKPLGNKIKAIRLVDRYLEHSRIFIFHNGGNPEVYMGSADWMQRNLYHRIEVIFPILDKSLKKEVISYIAFQLHDNTKARILDEELNNNVILSKNGTPEIRAQRHFYLWLKKKEESEMIAT
ncbi:MAG: polyphosphate kinase 1 [Bacteroidetes bacterium]|nr:polyphosphate kinase 1 [Bacteroidota bacterium]